MFKTGDRVRYIGGLDWRRGEEWTVKTSINGPQYRGGGHCTFYEKPGLVVSWANLEEIFPISLENK